MPRASVKLMNDYGVDWPLWGRDGLAYEGEWLISPELSTRLKAWAANFNAHFHYERGWDGTAKCQEHRTEGISLHQLLSDELGQDFDVTVDLWETTEC
jgi:hypothetical protein